MGAALKLQTALILLVLSVGCRRGAGAGTGGVQQHVVGGDQGWDVSSDIAPWSSTRIFKVGDLIWFGYEVAHKSVVELQNIHDYTSCDVSNPIRMLLDGLNKIALDKKGIRYFVSGNTESCKNGLKLHMEVQSKDQDKIPTVELSDGNEMVMATEPTPSILTNINELSFMLLIGFQVSHIVAFL